MTDPKAGKYSREYQREFEIAALVLKPYKGALTWATDDYIAFRYRSDKCCIVFYPHRTSAGNYHLRVREVASADKAHAAELMARLDVGAGPNCTFTQKSTAAAYFAQQKLRDLLNLKLGWAAEQVKIK